MAGRYGDFEAALTGAAEYPPGAPLTWNSRIETSGRVYQISGSYFKDEFFRLQGDHGLEALVLFQQDRVEFQTSLDEFPLTFREKDLFLTFDSQGYWASGVDWLFRADRTRLEGLSSLWGGSADDTLSFSGAAAPDFVRIMNMEYSDGSALLKGNGEFRYDLPAQTASGWLQMNDTSGEESFTLVTEYRDSLLDGSMDILGFPLARIGFEALSGRLNGRARFEGPWDAPDLFFEMAVADGEFNETPVSLSGEVALRGNTLGVLQWDASYLNHGITIDQVSFDLPRGVITGGGRIQGAWQDDPYSADFLVDITTEPIQ